MIEAVKGVGNTCLALCKCDDCAAETSFNALHDNERGSFHKASERKMTIREPGMVNKRLQDKGWAVDKNRIRCPACEAKRKTQKAQDQAVKQRGPIVANVTELRKPTREQRRAIMALLDEVYDTTAGHYRGAETDVTVAETIGGGCMFGWVTDIRVENYGDSGDNEESGKLVADLTALLERVTAIQTEASATKLEVSRALDRVNAMAKAIGPKGRAI